MMMAVDEHSIWMVKSQDAVGVTTQDDNRCLPSAIDPVSDHHATLFADDPFHTTEPLVDEFCDDQNVKSKSDSILISGLD